MRWAMRTAAVWLLLLMFGRASGGLMSYAAELEAEKSLCSACSIVGRMLEEAPMSSALVSSWRDWTVAERGKALGKALRNECPRIALQRIARIGNPGVWTYMDKSMLDKASWGFKEEFDMGKDSKVPGGGDPKPEHSAAVQKLCGLIASEGAPKIAASIDAWLSLGDGKRRRRKRRLVDFSILTDGQMCSGGVLSACAESAGRKDTNKAKAAAGGRDDDDDDDDDDRDEL